MPKNGGKPCPELNKDEITCPGTLLDICQNNKSMPSFLIPVDGGWKTLGYF